MADFSFKTLEYTRPDFEKLKKESEELTKQVKRAESYEDIKAAMIALEGISSKLETQATIAFIRNTWDTTD